MTGWVPKSASRHSMFFDKRRCSLVMPKGLSITMWRASPPRRRPMGARQPIRQRAPAKVRRRRAIRQLATGSQPLSPYPCAPPSAKAAGKAITLRRTVRQGGTRPMATPIPAAPRMARRARAIRQSQSRRHPGWPNGRPAPSACPIWISMLLSSTPRGSSLRAPNAISFAR